MRPSNPKHVKVLLSILAVVVILAIIAEFYVRHM